MATAPQVIAPPINEVPVNPDTSRHTPVWTDFYQGVADRLAATAQQITDMQAQLGTGVTDGSDAVAGKVGEYLSASGSGSLTSAAPVDRVTLTLSPGDWDVAGSATITPNIANMTFAQAWLATAANTPTDPGRAGIQSGGAGTLGAADLVVGTRRFSVTAPTDVHLGCQANFPGGTAVTAAAFIRARRMR